ncbi:hypothetical protein [Streptomyces daliensis]|uniref:Large membrane protein n=1 Tax=Streptomyces daliensis TaxID=299421 RepID=A0A8T4IL72_9ACTN|nr:hypothetical protein [Streptomyces daliensis]
MSTEPSPVNDGDATHPDAPAKPDERSARRRGPRLTVLAVATAVLLAGGGGAYWASTAGSGDQAAPGGGSEPPPLALDGLALGEQASEGGEKDIAPGEPTNTQPLRADGPLPDGPSSAAVHRPAPDGVKEADVAALAKALDVPGSPEKEDGRWVVAEDGKKNENGTGPLLTVSTGEPAGSWTYSAHGSTGGPDSGKGEPVSAEEAKDAVRPALKALKQEGAELDASATAASQRTVSAAPEVAGLPTNGWNSSFTVDSDGELARAHGTMARLDKGPTYPVLSAKDTLKQLNKQRAAGGGAGVGCPKNAKCANPLLAVESGASDSGSGSGKQESVKVTDAAFGLATHYSSGKPVLVPSWIYDVELPGGTEGQLTHPALGAKHLKPSGDGDSASTAPAPGGSPSDPGSGSGSGGGDIGTGGGSEAGAQAVTSYTSEGNTLKLTFWGGVCDKYEASADESGERVEVTVEPKDPDPDKMCVKMAKRQTVEVELDKALGDREVVDAKDGDTLPHKK